MVKRRIALVLAAGMIMTMGVPVMAEDFLGDWYTTMGNVPATLTFEENGDCKLAADGQETIGKWELDGNIITMSDEEENSSEIEISEDGESLVASGMAVFTRDEENAVPFEPAAVAADFALEDLAGAWSITDVLFYEGLYKPIMLEMEEATINIEENLVDFKMIGGFMIGEWDYEDLEGTFEDGCLKFVIPKVDEYTENIPCEIRLLEDGMIEIAYLDEASEHERKYYMEKAE